LKPFSHKDYMTLLVSKPTKEWEYITTFLIKRRLLLLPKLENFDFPTRVERASERPDFAKVVKAVKSEKSVAHEARMKAQLAAAAKKKETRQKAHILRVEQQKAAKVKRDASVKTAHEARLQAAKSRISSSRTAAKVTSCKKGADVKRWMEHRRTVALQEYSHCDFQLAVDSLPPLECVRQIVRPDRALVSVKDLPHLSIENCEVAFKAYQRDLIEADRHLHYLFNEADSSGWRTVQRKKVTASGGRQTSKA